MDDTEDIDRARAEALATFLGEQIAEMPEAAAAVQRMAAVGIAGGPALGRLQAAALAFVRVPPEGTDEFDRAGYAAAVEALPMVSEAAAVQALVDVVRQRRAVFGDRIPEFVTKRLGIDPADPVSFHIVGEAELALMTDPTAAVVLLAPDILVHVPTLVGGAVLTHRLSETESAESYLVLDGDLAGFLRYDELQFGDGVVEVDDPGGTEPVVWEGPEGWLDEFPPTSLLAVQVVGSEVRIEVLASDPVAPEELLTTLRASYAAESEGEVDEDAMPVSAEQLLLAMLYRDVGAFAEPRPPFSELAAAIGLQQRRAEFAHDASLFTAADLVDRQYRLEAELGPDGDIAGALAALDEIADPDPTAQRRALDRLQEPDLLVAVTEELLQVHLPAGVAVLADRLVDVAGTGPRAAVAAWIAARAAERDGRVLDAESHLRAASRFGDGWAFVEDQLARYEFDRGDAAAALGRWQSIETPADDPDVVIAAHFALATGPAPGRNEPCWCGSGRKYKQCHLGRPTTATLQHRTAWLYRKALGYVEQYGPDADVAVAAYGAAAGLGDDLDAAFGDVLVMDVVLAEGGWLGAFLTDRGPLLPPEEAELVGSWLKVERSLYEVLSGGRVRDVRTAETVAVPGLSFPTGTLLCGLLLPDGVAHAFSQAVFAVPEQERDGVLELLRDRQGFALLRGALAV